MDQKRSRISQELLNVTEYLDKTREVGHTLCMINGVKHTPEAIILCSTVESGKQLAERHIVRNATTPAAMLGDFRGEKAAPLAFDNAAIHQLMMDAAHEIDRLQHEVSRMLRNPLPRE